MHFELFLRSLGLSVFKAHVGESSSLVMADPELCMVQDLHFGSAAQAAQHPAASVMLVFDL